MPDPGLTFDALVAYHKMESGEELTSLTIIYTVILGLFAYLGQVKNVKVLPRILMSISFTIFMALFLEAFYDAALMHSAIHEEIAARTKATPSMVVSETLRARFCNLGPLPVGLLTTSGVLLGLLVIVGLLFWGEGSLLDRKGKDSASESPETA